MVSDQEPRYRLVDPDADTIVGTLYAKSDDTLALQEGTSGNDNEVTMATDGTLGAPALITEEVNNRWHFASSESELTSKLDTARTAGGGVVALDADVTTTSVVGVPDNTVLYIPGGVTLTGNYAGPVVRPMEPDGVTDPAARDQRVLRAKVLGEGTIDGGNTATRGVDFIGTQLSEIGPVKIQNCTSDGWALRSGDWSGGGSYYNLVRQTHAYSNGGHGGHLLADPSRGVNNNTIYTAMSKSNGQQALKVDGGGIGATRNAILNFSAELNDQDGTEGTEVEFINDADGNFFTGISEPSVATNSCFRVGSGAGNNTFLGLNSGGQPTFDLTNAGFGNKAYSTFFFRSKTTDASGVVEANINTGTTANVRPAVNAYADTGQPVAVTTYKTNGNGNYTGATLQLKDFSGADAATSGVRVWYRIGFST